MSSDQPNGGAAPPPASSTPADSPGTRPLTRVETITALVHFYRGELYRSQNWRNRLDTTTNWAVVASLGILTFSLDNPRYAGEILIAGMYVNLVFLWLEARRFRFFDVWRSRVRMMEENFFGPILRRAPGSAVEHWGEQVADDLLDPKFKITLQQAVKARLTRNYMQKLRLDRTPALD